MKKGPLEGHFKMMEGGGEIVLEPTTQLTAAFVIPEELISSEVIVQG